VMPRPHPLNVAADAVTLLAFVFMFSAAWLAHRRGQQRKAWSVAAVVFVLFLVDAADKLQTYGAMWDVYLTQLAFAALVIGVSIALRRQSSRTDAELAGYRSHLEALVDERLRDLEVAHARLAQESRERLATAGVLRRRVAELDALQHISRMLADRSDLDTVLRQIAPVIASFLEADHVRVVVAGDEANESGRAEAEPPEPHHEAAAGLLVVPLVARGHAVGALHVSRDEGEPFSDQERRLAQTVADDVAAAVENELLHAQQTREAAEEERQRLARDLHDAVSQTVYSAVLIAEALPAVWERDPDEGLRNLARLQRLVRAALAEMRALLYELRPAALEAAPLGSLLDRLGDVIAGQLQGTVTVRADEVLDLAADDKLVLYRVTQEALSNIIKHAQATEATVDVTAGDGMVSLRVQDNGKGFDLDRIGPSGMGIRMMRERLEKAGGSLAIQSAAGQGTTIRAVLPGPTQTRAAAEAV
jgi:signal transduction histidine kinase